MQQLIRIVSSLKTINVRDVEKILVFLVVVVSIIVLYSVNTQQPIEVAAFPLVEEHVLYPPLRSELRITYKDVINNTVAETVVNGLTPQLTIKSSIKQEHAYMVVKASGVDIYSTIMVISGVTVYCILYRYVISLATYRRLILLIVFTIVIMLALTNLLVISMYFSIPYSIVDEKEGTLHLLNPVGTIGNYTMYLFKKYIDGEKLIVFSSNETEFVVMTYVKNYTKGVDMKASRLFMIYLNKSFIGQTMTLSILVPGKNNVSELNYKEITFYRLYSDEHGLPRPILYFPTPSIYLLSLIVGAYIRRSFMASRESEAISSSEVYHQV